MGFFISISQIYLPYFSPESENRRLHSRNGVMVKEGYGSDIYVIRRKAREMKEKDGGVVGGGAAGGMWKNMAKKRDEKEGK